MKTVTIKNISIGPNLPLVLISGPCVIESEESAFQAAYFLKDLAQELNIPFIYKSSYDKANRSSYHGFRGPGLIEGLKILEKIKTQLDLPVLSDVHTVEEVNEAKKVLDVLQIPAFLCRQTDLVVACAETSCAINVKKGQFLAPWDMKNVVDKITTCGNEKIILTERGTSFGYNNLVADMRSIPFMQNLGYPVCFDGTHSTQLPGAQGTQSGGQREMIAPLSKAAVAIGCNAIFLESHQDPMMAKSDAATVIAQKDLKGLLQQLITIHNAITPHHYATI
ncbi:MAG: 3-deoxy-8-phosphooctulonate synthase [Chlamydiae bacterium]|nr:3-deoxy-8-phosphooctulonate synthase [Chlamydiota bacterium]